MFNGVISPGVARLPTTARLCEWWEEEEAVSGQ